MKTRLIATAALCLATMILGAGAASAQNYQTQDDKFFNVSIFSPTTTYVVPSIPVVSTVGATYITNAQSYYGSGATYGYVSTSYTVYPQTPVYYTGWVAPAPTAVTVSTPVYSSYWAPSVSISTWNAPVAYYPSATYVSVSAW